MDTETQPAREKDVEQLLDYQDIDGPITLPVLEDRVETIREEDLVYREAFRNYDATGIASNVVQIPVPLDDGGYPKIVDEGSEFPRSHEEYELKEMYFDKFGFEVPLSMEAIEDSRIDLVDDQIDKQARDMAEDINARAFSAILDNVTPVNQNGNSTVNRDNTDVDGTLQYTDVLAGREELLRNSYRPDLLVVDTKGYHDLLDSDNFLRATELGDELRRDGAVGRIAGMEVIEDNSGLPITRDGKDSSNPGCLMVDTEVFGYEGERNPVTTEEYESVRTQEQIYRIFTRMGWLVTQSQAAAIIEG